MIDDCKIIKIPVIEDVRGNIAVVEESNDDIPFDIKRTYYLYNVKDNVNRGSHAHKALRQFVIAINGSFDVNIDDGYNKQKYKLDNPNEGLYLCPMIWRELTNFSSNSICLVVASEVYDEDDYIRDYDLFLKLLEIN